MKTVSEYFGLGYIINLNDKGRILTLLLSVYVIHNFTADNVWHISHNSPRVLSCCRFLNQL